jgi:DNA-binding NarL/FixJ family response regulator
MAFMEPLTERESEVLALLVLGHSNRDIARDLLVSPSTVKAHVEHILRKLDARDRTDAAVRAIRLRLIE